MESDYMLDVQRKIRLKEITGRRWNWLSIWSSGRLTEDADKVTSW
jgi:hypothetical protein